MHSYCPIGSGGLLQRKKFAEARFGGVRLFFASFDTHFAAKKLATDAVEMAFRVTAERVQRAPDSRGKRE
jgi:hypothetical protein